MKVHLFLAGLIFVSLVFAGFVVADETVMVYGNIYENGSIAPMGGATVTVTCDATGDTIVLTSDSGGRYNTDYGPFTCPIDSTITVSATKGSLSGSVTGVIMEDYDEFWEVNLYLSEINVPIFAPEILSALAAIALAGPAFGYLIVRKKD